MLITQILFSCGMLLVFLRLCNYTGMEFILLFLEQGQNVLPRLLSYSTCYVLKLLPMVEFSVFLLEYRNYSKSNMYQRLVWCLFIPSLCKSMLVLLVLKQTCEVAVCRHLEGFFFSFSMLVLDMYLTEECFMCFALVGD